MSLSCRERRNTSGMWVTQLSVSQEFIFWIFGLCCFALLEQWFVWEKLGFSLHFLLAHVSVIPWWHKEKIGLECYKFGCCTGKQLWMKTTDTMTGSELCRSVTSQRQWRVLNGTLWQLGGTAWKLMAWEVHRKPCVVQIKFLFHCLCVKSVESMNKCIAHTAAGTVNGGGRRARAWMGGLTPAGSGWAVQQRVQYEQREQYRWLDTGRVLP